jgi:uncharacterized iron-regulated membrane protein
MSERTPNLAARRWVQLAHRWLGAALLLQFMLWMASGAFMSLVNMDQVRGGATTAISASPELQARAYFPPGGVISELSGVKSVLLENLDARPVYIVTHSEGESMFDAETGNLISLSGAAVTDIAKNSYVGDGEPISAVLITLESPVDYRGSLPVWQVRMDDKARTRIYVSPSTGRVIAHRNRLWRVYDFFWMLHIMDYEGRSDYSNPLLRIFSVTGLFFVLTGGVLAWTRVRSGRYRQDVKRLLR